MRKKIFLLTLIYFVAAPLIYAGAPKVLSVTMNPSNPGYGDTVQIEVTVCSNKYTDSYIAVAFSEHVSSTAVGTYGQVFVVSSDGVDNAKRMPNAEGTDLGYLFAAIDSGAAPDCTDCGGELSSRIVVRNYIVKIPEADKFGSCGTEPLYLHLVLKASSLVKSDWEIVSECNSYSSSSWTLPVPVQDFTLHQDAEGAFEISGDMILYKIYYEYANGTLTINDVLPGSGNLSFVEAGPASLLISSPSAGSTSGTIAWTLPDRTGMPGKGRGVVWFAAELNTNIPAGTVITNTVSGDMPLAGTKNYTRDDTAGTAILNIRKNQDKDLVVLGDTVSYYINYEANGYVLKSFREFSDASGVYSGGTAPPGWVSIAEAGVHGTWTVEDPCGTGGNYITGSSYQYPSLLLDAESCSDSSDQFCEGIIVADVMINTATTFSGADAAVVLRSNGQTGTDIRAYNLVISIDNFPGYFMIEKYSGDSGITWPAGGMPSIGPPILGMWYRVKALVTNGASDQRIRAKIWERGAPEPTEWDIDYADTSAFTADFDCRGSGTWNDWRPGVVEKSGDYDDTLNSYDNFTVYEARYLSDVYVEDDIPAGITYSGCSGCSSIAPVSWNLGTVSYDSGSMTWFGSVDICGTTVTNQALIGGTGLQDIYSNEVALEALCFSSTLTPTVTETTGGDTPTSTPSKTSTPTMTMTENPAVSMTYTPTVSETITLGVPSNTPTSISTATLVVTVEEFTHTATLTNTATGTRTATPTVTSTGEVFTYTATPTVTFTPTVTITGAATIILTHTPTPTITPTAAAAGVTIIDNILDGPGDEMEIKLVTQKSVEIKIKIYNKNGVHIKTIVDEVKPAGVHNYKWDGTNDGGESVVSGIYILSIKTGDMVRTEKVAVIK